VSRLGELRCKVDAFFARVEARHGTDMQCQTGCSDCCHVRLTITQIEAEAIRADVAAWPVPRRAALAHTGPEDHCAALDGAGRCRIYDVRPLVCRSHGVPIRLRRGALPVIEACHHNFRRTTPEADCVLDQTTLSATLFAIDAAARAPGADPGPARVELAGLLAELAAI
jgi:uncharacterized protein